MSNYLEIAQKLYALAVRGEQGEKYNAKKALDRLMKKHGITMEQLEGEKSDWCDFKIQLRYHSLFFIITMSVIGKKSIDQVRINKRFRTNLRVNCTRSHEVEIRCKFDFYLREFKKQEKIFFRGFVQKNELYPPDANSRDFFELSLEERKEAVKAMLAAEGIDKAHYCRQLQK